MTDKLELIRQIGADMQADPEGWFNNLEYRHVVSPPNQWGRCQTKEEAFRNLADPLMEVRRSPKPLITHDQIPWKWLKWSWVVMNSKGRWFNSSAEPHEQATTEGWQNHSVFWVDIGSAIKMPVVPTERWRETKMRRPD